ncbi:GNAT family N-acetyltransferase [Paenibacillus solisilvae]|uniref:GNAT family N-acetyltransferase n=1 Tax=Paenibacillus solisilvae TaxID=2486751 RepID=A0ABW0VT97_9BACL
MNVDIRAVSKGEYGRFHAFQCEYLDVELYSDFMNRMEANPDLYLAAFAGNELAGICYGQPSLKDDAAVTLQGIAVNLDETKKLARTGIGSMLIAKFQEAAACRGYSKIDLGAADDRKVEHFYLKNGFVPYELVAKGRHHEEYKRTSVHDYETGKVMQEKLRSKHNAKEVIFIFEKIIG